MILGVEVLCEACGTELEITDVNTDYLLKVTLEARPCSKCSRPPDCQLSCEDVLELKKKVKTLSSLIPIEEDKPKCFGTDKSTSDCNTCSFLLSCAETENDNIDDEDKHPRCLKCELSYPSEACDNIGCNGSKNDDDEDFNGKETEPACYGHFYNHTGNCIQRECLYRIPCKNKK